MSKKFPACPTCGRQYEGAMPVNGRVCPRCLVFQQHACFPTANGMCDACRAIKQALRGKKHKAYHAEYYQRVTKPKRQLKSPTMLNRLRVAEAVAEFEAMLESVSNEHELEKMG
jgi:hypothetical protein